MGYHPRIEDTDKANFLTTRCMNEELWFANNRPVEKAILGYLARYKQRYQVKVYGLAIEGDHIQSPMRFPGSNRSDFMRDFNGNIARAVARLTPHYRGGTLWGRRYSQEFVPRDEDLEEEFFYTALQPVADGLAEKLSEYPFYHFFYDAVWGIERTYEVFNVGAYNKAKLRNPLVRKRDYIDRYTLKYDRLPGYEHLSQKDYAELMYKKLEERRVKIVKERLAQGKGFMGREALLKVVPGTRAKNPKKSTINSHRPRVLSVCPKRREVEKEWYFTVYFAYKEASKRYRAGELDVEFPPGTYKPYLHPNTPSVPVASG